MFQLMSDEDPSFFLQLGDFTYPDHNHGANFPQTDSLLEASYRDKYEYYNIEPLLSHVPIDYLYDDHDYVDDNSGRDTRSDDYNFQGPNGIETVVLDIPLHPEARQSAIEGYIDYFPGYATIDTSEGLYHSFRFANVEVFFLDNRSARSPNNETFSYDSTDTQFPWSWEAPPGHTILGSTQMQWLKDGLTNSNAHWKFIASGTTFNRAIDLIMEVGIAFQRIQMNLAGSASGTGMDLTIGFGDGWAGFPEDQDTLVSFIKRNQIGNVVMLTGDTHTSAMDDGTNAGIPEFNSSCMTVSSGSIKLYHLVDSIGQNLLGQPAVLDSMWNKGGSGLGNTNFNPRFGRVEIFGNDSIRMCQIDKFGNTVMCWTMMDGFQPPTFTNWKEVLNHPAIQLYPNPASGYLNIDIELENLSSGEMEFRIFDVSGKLALQQSLSFEGKSSKIDVSKLSAGPYVLSVVADEVVMNKQFTIAR